MLRRSSSSCRCTSKSHVPRCFPRDGTQEEEEVENCGGASGDDDGYATSAVLLLDEAGVDGEEDGVEDDDESGLLRLHVAHFLDCRTNTSSLLTAMPSEADVEEADAESKSNDRFISLPVRRLVRGVRNDVAPVTRKCHEGTSSFGRLRFVWWELNMLWQLPRRLVAPTLAMSRDCSATDPEVGVCALLEGP
ncbi:hypothetical protein FI667_g2318, partial [Globisporangium splendens]